MKRGLLSLILIAIACFLAGFGIGSSLGDRTVEVAPEVTIDPAKVPAMTLDLDNQAEAPAEDEGVARHEDLRDETPPDAPKDAAERVLDSPMSGRGPPVPVGGAQNYSCPKRLVRNYSDRASGSRVGIFVLHFTVSRPGTLDVIRGLFDRPSFGASSHLGLEPGGRCEQWVEFGKKAWTQGAFNSVAESVEIICCNVPVTRSWWMAQPIIKNGILAQIVADRLRARGIQPRRVDPGGCGVQIAGWTDHNALECGNSHTDVSPNFPYDTFAAQVRAAYSAEAPLPGPSPKPAWFWQWANWKLGGEDGPRPAAAPLPIPDWAWDALAEWQRRHP